MTLNLVELDEVSGGGLQPLGDELMRASMIPTILLSAYVYQDTSVSYTGGNPFNTAVQGTIGAGVGASVAISDGARNPYVIGASALGGAVGATQGHFTLSWK
ncbi:MAG: hypothetical protein VXW65_05370 [Pseudomonadota bacterium]|nr:hypothetical protein [Pseudomonadota bacterium]